MAVTKTIVGSNYFFTATGAESVDLLFADTSSLPVSVRVVPGEMGEEVAAFAQDELNALLAAGVITGSPDVFVQGLFGLLVTDGSPAPTLELTGTMVPPPFTDIVRLNFAAAGTVMVQPASTITGGINPAANFSGNVVGNLPLANNSVELVKIGTTNISGATPALNPANGAIQNWPLTEANTTPTFGPFVTLSTAGLSVSVAIVVTGDGAKTITFPAPGATFAWIGTDPTAANVLTPAASGLLVLTNVAGGKVLASWQVLV